MRIINIRSFSSHGEGEDSQNDEGEGESHVVLRKNTGRAVGVESVAVVAGGAAGGGRAAGAVGNTGRAVGSGSGSKVSR